MRITDEIYSLLDEVIILHFTYIFLKINCTKIMKLLFIISHIVNKL